MDTDFGYDGPGDSPAYSRPHAGGIVTTYLGDVLYRGTAAAWQLVNLHGDVVGTTDAAGAFTAHPSADEFGVGQVPADRLGWLGGKDRFNVGGRLGLIRMGVRLYDTTTGRFTSVDPLEGGSCNDYDYACADSVNNFDLDGQRCWSPRCAAKAIGGAAIATAKRVGSAGKAAGRAARSGARVAVRVGSRVVSGVDSALTVYEAATGRWRQAVVSYVGGIAVGSTCIAGTMVATGGIGVVGAGACSAAGVAAGQFLAGRVKDRRR